MRPTKLGKTSKRNRNQVLKDWKKVEDFLGTRTGAQIRSHAQKYFLRIEDELHCTGLAFRGSDEDGEYGEEEMSVAGS